MPRPLDLVLRDNSSFLTAKSVANGDENAAPERQNSSPGDLREDQAMAALHPASAENDAPNNEMTATKTGEQQPFALRSVDRRIGQKHKEKTHAVP